MEVGWVRFVSITDGSFDNSARFLLSLKRFKSYKTVVCNCHYQSQVKGNLKELSL